MGDIDKDRGARGQGTFAIFVAVAAFIPLLYLLGMTWLLAWGALGVALGAVATFASRAIPRRLGKGTTLAGVGLLIPTVALLVLARQAPDAVSRVEALATSSPLATGSVLGLMGAVVFVFVFARTPQPPRAKRKADAASQREAAESSGTESGSKKSDSLRVLLWPAFAAVGAAALNTLAGLFENYQRIELERIKHHHEIVKSYLPNADDLTTSGIRKLEYIRATASATASEAVLSWVDKQIREEKQRLEVEQNYDKTLAQLVRAQATIKALHQKIKELQRENKELRKENKQAKEQLRELQRRLEAEQFRVSRLQGQLIRLSDKLASLSSARRVAVQSPPPPSPYTIPFTRERRRKPRTRRRRQTCSVSIALNAYDERGSQNETGGNFIEKEFVACGGEALEVRVRDVKGICRLTRSCKLEAGLQAYDPGSGRPAGKLNWFDYDGPSETTITSRRQRVFRRKGFWEVDCSVNVGCKLSNP